MKSFINTSARPITSCLNSVAPGMNLNPHDVHAIMHLCPFETHSKPPRRRGLVRPVPCSRRKMLRPTSMLGTSRNSTMEGAYISFRHHLHVLIALFIRYGGSLEPVQGVGYINELIGCLTIPLHILSSPKTFPLDRAMYVDFSHDNVIATVFAAMGLFNQSSEPLDPTKSTKRRTWVTSKMVACSLVIWPSKGYLAQLTATLASSRSQLMMWWNWTTMSQESY